MEPFDKVWSRLMECDPQWRVLLASRSLPADTVVMTWLKQDDEGVLKVTVEAQEVQSVQKVQRTMLEVLFFPGAVLEHGKLDEKKFGKSKVELHKTAERVDFDRTGGFFGLGRGWSPVGKVPAAHALIMEYAGKAGAREAELRAVRKTEGEAAKSIKAARVTRTAAQAFFGS